MEKIIIINFPNVAEKKKKLNRGKDKVVFYKATLNHNAISVMIGIFP